MGIMINGNCYPYPYPYPYLRTISQTLNGFITLESTKREKHHWLFSIIELFYSYRD